MPADGPLRAPGLVIQSFDPSLQCGYHLGLKVNRARRLMMIEPQLDAVAVVIGVDGITDVYRVFHFVVCAAEYRLRAPVI